MTRVLCLWFPNWPIQRRQQQFRVLRDQPLILIANPHGRETVGHCCPLATQSGIREGMSLTEARTLLQPRSGGPERGKCLPEEPELDQQALKQLAWECEVFSPFVGLEQAEPPESLMLDVSGCAPLFGGEQELVQQVIDFCQQHHWNTRVGLADSFGTAWAAARFRTKQQASCIVPSGKQKVFLTALPISALRLNFRTLDRLNQVGVKTVGQLLKLSRSALPSRFGPELLQRIDQALGDLPEMIIPERRPEPLQESWEAEDSIFDIAVLEAVADDLLTRILDGLRPLGHGIKRLRWELNAADQQKTIKSLELVQPTTHIRHLLSLLSLQWEQVSLSAGIRGLALCAERVEFLTARRGTLWELETEEASPAFHQLMETLSSRLGRDAVLRPYLRADHQPELASGFQSVIGEEPAADALRITSTTSASSRTRPLWLKHDPVTVDVIARHRDGPPARFHWQQQDWNVRQSWGPERITTAWWRGPIIRRDYFQVECEQGQRFWLFRELVTGKWFLHATFD